MKNILLLIILAMAVFGRDLIVFENEFNVFTTDRPFTQVVIGNQELLKATVVEDTVKPNQTLRLFGKKSGNTSLLIRFNDNTMINYQVYVNQNLGFIQKMVNYVAPAVTLHRAGDGSTVLGGHFSDPHQKKRVYELLSNAGIDANRTMDLSTTQTVEKMIRTKLYLVSVDNDRAEELGGAVGLSFFAKNGNIALNPSAKTYATFSGFLLDQTGLYANSGKSLMANLNFLQSKGVAKILDDTVLLSTEDQNASFHVGGRVYIPVGVTYNAGTAPTINLEEKEYGLRLTIKPKFLEKKDFMGINVNIEDSEFDTDPAHQVQLGENIFVPAFRAKNIDTDVVAQSGQVISLGGRLHTEALKQEEKVPLLGDIPILGHLFKRTVDSKKANDLIFFLVPEIVDSNEKVDEGQFYRSFKEEADQVHNKIFDETLMSVKVQGITEKINAEVHQPLVRTEKHSTVSESKEILNVNKNLKVQPSSDEQVTFYYKVTAPYLNIRNAPKDGKSVRIWKKGHTFSIGEEMTVENVVWVKIIENCTKGKCMTVSEPLWISKNHIVKN